MIQREVQDRVADLILAGEARARSAVVLDVHDGEFVTRTAGALEAAD